MPRAITAEEKQYAQELLHRARAAQEQIAHLDQAAAAGLDGHALANAQLVLLHLVVW